MIAEMEGYLEQGEAVLAQLEQALEEFERLAPSLKKLFAYYESSDWLRHCDMEEQGAFPKEMPRGILSQDAIYNLFLDYQDLKKSLKELGD